MPGDTPAPACPRRRLGPTLFPTRALAAVLALAFLLGLGAVAPLSALAKEPPSPPGPAPAPNRPAYAVVFEKAAALQSKGDWAGALRAVSAVYAEEVPVDAFYRSLEDRKLDILAKLQDQDELVLPPRSYLMGEMKQLFRDILLVVPDLLWQRYETGRDLPLARFLYIMVVMGQPQEGKPAKDGLLKPVAPRVDLTQAVASPDPWIVSAALFLARKGWAKLEPAPVLKRWQARPDLWDDICTQQALLFLAAQEPDTLTGIEVKNQDVAAQLDGLKPLAPTGAAPVQALDLTLEPLALEDSAYLTPVACNGLGVSRLGMGKAPSGKGEAVDGGCQDGWLALEPGRYSLRIFIGKVQGSSRPFDLKAGQMARVVVATMGQI